MISVIIPVYNTERYLRQCIDSVLSQPYLDFEVLLIDDGSKDRSGEICDEYATKDNRVRVIHKKNGGVSSARNVGIDEAKGEWISFVDSDDTFTPDALEYMVHLVEEHDADVCLCPVVREEENEPSTKVLSSKEQEELIWACLAFRTDQYCKYGFMVDAPHAKLFRTSIMRDNNIRYVEGLSRSEDAIFDAWYYQCAKTIVMDRHPVYHHRQNPTSICHSLDMRLPDMLARVLEEEKKFVEEYHHGNEYFNMSLYVRAMVALEQVMSEGPTKMLSFMQHVKFTKEYLNTPIVYECLQKLSYNTLNEYFTWRSRTLDLFLAKRKCALPLHIWTDDRWELNLRWERAKGRVRDLVMRTLPMVYKRIHTWRKPSRLPCALRRSDV